MRAAAAERRVPAIAVLLMGFAAAACSRGSTPALALAPAAPAANDPSGRPAPKSPPDLAAASAPAAAPALEVWDVARIRGEMRRRHGQPLVVHMWASWCGPCLQELPAIEAFARRARERGIAVLSLALDTDYRSGGRVAATLHDRAPHLTPIIAQFTDSGPFMAMFSRDWEGTIPALFVFDRAGTLQKSFLDAVEPAELDHLIEQLAPPARTPHSAP